MNISLEELINLVTTEVLKELKERGIQIEVPKQNVIIQKDTSTLLDSSKTLEITGYKTPLVTEENILKLDERIKEIIVPLKTIFTPSANDMIRKRKISIKRK